MTRTLKFIPPLLLLLLFATLVVLNWKPSERFDIYQFSYFRFAALAACVAGALVCALSLFFAALRNFVNALTGYFVAGMVCTEAALRLFPSLLVTNEVISLLPRDARAELGMERGLFTQKNLVGEGMLYAYRPHQALPAYPHVKIDSNGYRNATEPTDQADVVLLGGSVMQTVNARKDLADVIRANGMSAVNLGMGSYGPFNWRDSYKHYVIDRKVRHAFVMVMVMVPDSLDRADAYLSVVKNGGDYRDYLRGSSFVTTRFLDTPLTPWTVALMANLPHYLLQKWKNEQSRKSTQVPLNLSWGKVSVPEELLRLSQKPRDWSPFFSAIDEIHRYAAGAGAELIMAFYPDYQYAALPYVSGHEAKRRAISSFYESARARLRGFARENGIRFLDLSEAIQNRYREVQIFSNPMDYHPNGKGVETIYRQLAPLLKK